MRPTLALLLILAPAVLAQPQKLFPDDYQPSPCASAAPVCETFNQSQFADIAARRGYDIGQEWVNAHWEELTRALAPTCAKVATCFATPGNTSVFCNDILAPEAYGVCERYPEGSTDREKCRFFTRTFWFGHDRKSAEAWKKLQACTAGKSDPGAGLRTLDYWMTPARLGPDYDGKFTLYTVDRVTRVPIKAQVTLDVKQPLFGDAEDGRLTSFYPVPWKLRLKRVPNEQGHRDVVPPEVRIQAKGYEPVTFRLPIEVPVLTVTMEPSPEKLRRGRNTVTVTARDAATGEPVEARVMGGYAVLGKTNEPFELELGAERPEIWVTSLFDRYSDVVVAPAK